MQLLNLVFVHTVQSNTILEIGFKTAAAVQVWPQAAFRRHPFLVADLPQQPDIEDLYGYIIA